MIISPTANSLYSKKRINMLYAQTKKIIWLVGERSDNRFQDNKYYQASNDYSFTKKSDKHPISHTRFINFLFKCGLHKE